MPAYYAGGRAYADDLGSKMGLEMKKAVLLALATLLSACGQDDQPASTTAPEKRADATTGLSWVYGGESVSLKGGFNSSDPSDHIKFLNRLVKEMHPHRLTLGMKISKTHIPRE